MRGAGRRRRGPRAGPPRGARALLALVPLLAGPVAAPPLAAQEAPPFDLVIAGGRVIDGTGNPWFGADIGIRDGRIAAVGDLEGAAADRRVDARGRLVVPGFIDLHSHAGDEGGLGDDDPRRRAAPNLVSQGVTTVVVNQDGRSPWPIAAQRTRLRDAGIGPNAILMVGHNTVRGRVLGEDHRRLATAAEVERMRALVRRGLEEGAWGLSAGLEYVPGRWSDTEEVVALVEEVAPRDGVFIVHERSSGTTPMWWWPSRDEPGPPTMLETILEDIEVAERTGVRVVATHIKARGADFWGSGRAMIHFIERARDRGVSIWADQYPYATTGSDGNTVLLPDWWVREACPDAEAFGTGEEANPCAGTDFPAALREALADGPTAEALRRDVAHEVTRRGGPENLVLMDHPDSALVGESVADLAEAWDATPVEVAFRLQLEGYRDRPGGARIRGFSLSEIDAEAFAARPWTVTASDAGIALPGDGPVHARYYGTFPRKIRRYAMERGILSVADAVRSATSLPAQILGLRDRGLVREGFRADIAVLDPGRLEDRATFFEPHRYAAGVELVLVNGEPVVEAGELTWALPGRVLSRHADGPADAPAAGRR